MKVSKEQMDVRCFVIEAMVRSMVINGITDNDKLVEAVDNVYRPETEEEMERYSEAIINAKFGVLN